MAKNLGKVTAYAHAKVGGYTGTEAEFNAMLAGLDEYNEAAAQSAEEASGYAEEASGYADNASESASDAAGSVEQAASIIAEAISYNIRRFENKYTVSSSTSSFTFNPTGYTYSNGDRFEVYVNGSKLVDDEYTNSSNVITLTTAVSSGTVEIIGFKNVDLTTDTTLSLAGVAADAKKTGDEIAELKDDLEQIVPGLSEEAKTALLACFEKVAWINVHGQDYVDVLEAALYSEFPKITAVLDLRGHTVFTSDTLDSLKDYLTVTYYATHESAGTVLTASQYILTGQLVGGSNVIHVAYGNVTTAFNVIAVAMTVPSGYTRKDYVKLKEIYTDGIPTAALLLVNTGYDLNTLSYFVDLYVEQQISGSGGVAMFGGRSASGSGSSVAMYYNHTSFTLGAHVHGSDPGVISGFENAIQLQKICHTSLVNGSASPSVLSAGEESRNIAWTNSNVVNVPLAYFVNKNNADSASATNWVSSYLRLGIFEIKNISNETIRYLIPVVRDSDSVIGIYDGITGAFYCPSSTNYSKIGNSNCKYEVGMW